MDNYRENKNITPVNLSIQIALNRYYIVLDPGRFLYYFLKLERQISGTPLAGSGESH
jgi:hypothetical protein